jgi:hypothetical protein
MASCSHACASLFVAKPLFCVCGKENSEKDLADIPLPIRKSARFSYAIDVIISCVMLKMLPIPKQIRLKPA